MTEVLVSCQNRQAVTSSVTVGKVFRKRHADVLKAISKLVADLESQGISQCNFASRVYIDDRGKVYPMFEMNRDGFTLLAMGFTGKKALKFKLEYIAAFNEMERVLRQQENLSWQQTRAEGKVARRVETDTIASFITYAKGQGSKNPSHYFQNLTRMTNSALKVMRQAGHRSARDSLCSMELAFLTTAEYLIQRTLEVGIANNLPYKEIYQTAKEQVRKYASTLPLQRQITI